MSLPEFDIQALDRHLQQEGSVPLLLDLWAPWCGPCKAQAPALEKLSDMADGKLLVAKIDVDQHPAVGPRFKVRGIPTLILFNAGEEVSRRTGVQTFAGLCKWVVEEGVDLGDTRAAASATAEEMPLGGAFYDDGELREFLLGRVSRAASEGGLSAPRFPFWSEGKGSIMGALAHSANAEIFERVTGLPAAFGYCLEMASLTTAPDVQQAADLLPAGADMRNAPALFVQRWLGDAGWNWPELLGPEADRLRLEWLALCSELLAGSTPSKARWAAVREAAERFDGKDPYQSVQQNFASLVEALTPVPGSDEATSWGRALLMHGKYLVIARAKHELGWTAMDFAKEVILIRWFKAHCPNPQEKTREEMAALDAQFRAEHAEMLAVVEPKERHFYGQMEAFVSPYTLRVRTHLLAAMAPLSKL